MPIGEYQYSVDDKGRVIIPPSFRSFVENGMVVTRGLEGCLYVFTSESWSGLTTQLNDLPITDIDSSNFTRFFYSGATRTNIDSAGRITLPQMLRTFAGIVPDDNSVVIAGMPNRLEIWNEAKWLGLVLAQTSTPDLLRELKVRA